MKQRRYTRSSRRARPRVRTWLAAGLLAGLLAGLWVWLYGGPLAATATAALARANPRSADAPAGRLDKHARSRAQLQLLAELARSLQREAGARTTEPARVPHPITDDHRRLYRDVDLLNAAEQAIEQERYADAREYLLEHQRELPGMSPLEAEGLWLLVDCVERPSATNTARVQSFYDEHTASTVRRRLRRSCLERAQ